MHYLTDEELHEYVVEASKLFKKLKYSLLLGVYLLGILSGWIAANDLAYKKGYNQAKVELSKNYYKRK